MFSTRGEGAAGLRMEFDTFADEYESQHRANVALSGEMPSYFAEYKIRSLARVVSRNALEVRSILDFGSGIGNSIPYFRRYFPAARLHCADVSRRSMEISRHRFPGVERYVQVGGDIPLPAESQDMAFSACVFHHIPRGSRAHWLAELRRVVRPGGVLAIYEHNPLNPLTVRAVNACPFDVNAELIGSRALGRLVTECDWVNPHISFEVFFPAVLRRLRPLEPLLAWLPIGAQYRLIAYRSK